MLGEGHGKPSGGTHIVSTDCIMIEPRKIPGCREPQNQTTTINDICLGSPLLRKMSVGCGSGVLYSCCIWQFRLDYAQQHKMGCIGCTATRCPPVLGAGQTIPAYPIPSVASGTKPAVEAAGRRPIPARLVMASILSLEGL